MEDVGNPNPHFGRRSCVDSISSLPDEILHHILSFIPTKLAIETSVLSKRWRHVWCETPCLSFDCLNSSVESISQTLDSYSATKITSFRLQTHFVCPPYCLRRKSIRAAIVSKGDCHNVNSLLRFAISHNVDNLSLDLGFNEEIRFYGFPDLFFNNSSLIELTVTSFYNSVDPRCIVSWTSLRNLTLMCKLSDASLSKIISGCPMLESLTLEHIGSYLDLSKSLRLRRLDIDLYTGRNPDPMLTMKIVAPHIYSLRLRNLSWWNDGDILSNCNLVDVSSLTEANIYFDNHLPSYCCYKTNPLDDVQLRAMMQTMLEKLQNVETLTLGASFLQMLSITKSCGVPFPTFNVKALTLETMILQSVVPGIAKMLQNSPALKKIRLHPVDYFTIGDESVNEYLDKQDLNSEQWRRLKDVLSRASWEYWECQVAEPNLVALFVEVLLANTKTLETIVLQLGSYIDRSRFGELSQITHTLSRDNKVSIVLE